MPIPHRTFYINLLNKTIEKTNNENTETIDKSKSKIKTLKDSISRVKKATK